MNNILFAGTPDIAVPLLKTLAKDFNVVGVLTGCDKPQKRSSSLIPSPVKVAALELNIPVLQFESLRTEARNAVKALNADTLVTFAFGKIFGPMFLDLFPNGTFNVHPSDLPTFRGPSPVQSTILAGLRKATISVQKIGLKMDEGDIFSKCEIMLTGKENTKTLEDTVALKASEFVPKVLKDAFENRLQPKAQTRDASYCTMLDKSMATLDFNKKSYEIHAQIRAMYPWPKASAKASDKEVFITSVYGGFEELDNEELLHDVKPGTVIGMRKDKGIGIACKDKAIWVTSLQLPGKKELDFKSFVNGNSWILKAVFNDN